MNASGHESGEGDRVTLNGHNELPDEQGIANAVDAIGFSPKNSTGYIKIGCGETGSNPRIVTDLPET